MEIIIPIQVRDEVIKHDDTASSLIILEIENGWIKVERVELSPEISNVGDKLGLHRGEMYALSLAIRLDIREFLADDKMARVAARMLGLRSIGCLGVVMRAYETDIITRNDAIDRYNNWLKPGCGSLLRCWLTSSHPSDDDCRAAITDIPQVAIHFS